jgi:hypothetical protein
MRKSRVVCQYAIHEGDGYICRLTRKRTRLLKDQHCRPYIMNLCAQCVGREYIQRFIGGYYAYRDEPVEKTGES